MASTYQDANMPIVNGLTRTAPLTAASKPAFARVVVLGVLALESKHGGVVNTKTQIIIRTLRSVALAVTRWAPALIERLAS